MADLHLIRIDDAKAHVRVGVPDPERAAPQEVHISVTLALADPPHYPKHDRIAATVDYDRILHFIRDDLGEPAHLIETLADRVAGHCLTLSDRALWVEVTRAMPTILHFPATLHSRRERPH